ncbi:MAG TPA: histidine phosphatase family protein [Gemmataceae bacterium]|jgi:broad specificity phosphatase PhoE|nr:histidine phosphatase family protein [Gemmataceae bacterium]
MKTILYLLGHGATDANLARPARLQGRGHNPSLARLGVRQAEATRDFLAIRPIDHCFCSPMQVAIETATIVSAPHGLTPIPLEALTECDFGRWEGLDWQTIRKQEPQAFARFNADPADFGYPGGETFTDVAGRSERAIETILTNHAGESSLVVAHHGVNRIYLARMLGISLGQAPQLTLDTCGISVVIREGKTTTVNTLNAAFHLQGLAA